MWTNPSKSVWLVNRRCMSPKNKGHRLRENADISSHVREAGRSWEEVHQNRKDLCLLISIDSIMLYLHTSPGFSIFRACSSTLTFSFQVRHGSFWGLAGTAGFYYFRRSNPEFQHNEHFQSERSKLGVQSTFSTDHKFYICSGICLLSNPRLVNASRRSWICFRKLITWRSWSKLNS